MGASERFLSDELERCRERLAVALALDAEASARLQAAVLIGADAGDSAALQLAYSAMPSKMVAGDFLDLTRPRAGYLDLLLGDVMGKGMEAATLATVLKMGFLRAGAALSASGGLPGPRELCTAAESRVSGHFLARNSIATLIFMRVDENRGLAEFVDCGHTGLVHYRAATDDCRLVKGGDMPIGFVDRQDLRSFLLPLRPGDALVVFSDGLSECQNADGEAFGEDRVMRVVKARFDLSARELADGLVRLVFEFSRSGFSDDVTLVCLRVMAGVPEALHQGFLVLKLGSGTAEATRALRSAVLACLGKNGAVGEDADIIALACHEALENVAEHGLKGRDGTCRASWLCREGTFFLELSYRGDEYDWLARTAAPTESYRGRGYGQAIIREVMDSVLFCRGFDDEKSLILCRRTPWRK